MGTRGNHAVRRIAAAGLAFVMLLASLPASAAPSVPADNRQTVDEQPVTFTDVEKTFARQAVQRLASLRLISGQGGGRFFPEQAISRQDVAVLLAKVTGVKPKAPQNGRFTDVPADAPAAPYVYALTDAGVVRGVSPDRLAAKEPLTRQDLAVLLQRLMKLSANEPAESTAASYADESEIAAYAREAVQHVTAKRWIVGASGKFHPRRPVTRAEAAVIAERLLDARYMQAGQADFAVNTDRLRLPAGTSQRIEVSRPNGRPLPFTPIYSFDRPELGTIRPDGTFLAGSQAGSGQITVSVGYRTITIPVDITPNGSTAAGGDSPASPAESAPMQQVGLVNVAPDSFYSLRTTGPADSYFHELEKKYPGPVGGLVVPSETWTGYSRQFGREVTLTLPERKPVKRVTLTFKQDKKAGVLLPQDMEVEVSRDGKAWFYAGKVTHAVPAGEEAVTVRTLSLTLPSVEASHVRVRFPVKIFVFARQLEVWTAERPDENAGPIMLAPISHTKEREDKKTGERMENMLLAYSGAHGERGSWTKQDFLPMVGYMRPDGRMADRMFDTILFLPYPNLASTREGWEQYLNDLFRPGRQLDALNEAMMEYNKQRGTLYISPVRENVVLALPYPDPNQSAFGKLLEDQDSLSFQASRVGEERAYRYRKQAMEWYVDNLLKRWTEAEYRYLRLEGIYWYHELIDDAVPRERQLIRDAADMVHNQALRFYWIPYFGATGLGEWKELGFDFAFVQPNFYNDKPIPIDRIEATLAVANKYGMGIEIEGDERMYRDPRFYQTYYNQLIAAHRLGIDKNKVHAYYFGSKSLLEAVNSKDPVARAIYDDTYRWMRGQFTREDYLLPALP